MEVIWTEKAEKTYTKNYEYLVENWSMLVAEKFDEEVLKTIHHISKNPFLGRYNSDFNFRTILVVKQITLFYTVINNKIYLLLFHDNRQKMIKDLF
ncbi:MAG: type II toxin-antitoxin system RelE/ParE family toxin [Flavobacterium nitrogenifigens]|uniref:type II toxin-antitoxin system RelE/ParE family toxin n=1 Tax=Flavobacterium nitrogenifigens TaxID=1617283 RepID=UPI002808AE9D|nr:type II toxin-antitoxin system RelE/ParE family toxin [Flavobacterium nitrogenifigens]MDQ8014474.1 type II toxin-antitoxin system RelE/ParE family toxin [Flavobacterium nitrogenifigens]